MEPTKYAAGQILRKGDARLYVRAVELDNLVCVTEDAPAPGAVQHPSMRIPPSSLDADFLAQGWVIDGDWTEDFRAAQAAYDAEHHPDTAGQAS